MGESVTEPDDHKYQDRDSQRPVDGQQQVPVQRTGRQALDERVEQVVPSWREQLRI